MVKSPKHSGRSGGATRATTAPRTSAVPAVTSTSSSEVINLRVASGGVDQLDAAADAASTTRKVIIMRALAKAGFHIPQHDLEDRAPRRRRTA